MFDDEGDAEPASTNEEMPCKPAHKMSPEQARVFTFGIVPVLGFWNCMQESIITNLDSNNDEWAVLAWLWRTTEGRVNYILGGGSVKDALHELF